MIFLLVSVAGGIGAVCRMVLDDFVKARSRSVMPWGTIIVNLSGSFLLGLIVSLVLGAVLPDGWQLISGSGFLGGYTTFSTASVEAVRLAQGRHGVLAVINVLGTLVAGVAMASLGLWLGTLM